MNLGFRCYTSPPIPREGGGSTAERGQPPRGASQARRRSQRHHRTDRGTLAAGPGSATHAGCIT